MPTGKSQGSESSGDENKARLDVEAPDSSEENDGNLSDGTDASRRSRRRKPKVRI